MSLNQKQKDFLEEILKEEQKKAISIREKFIINDIIEEIRNQ